MRNVNVSVLVAKNNMNFFFSPVVWGLLLEWWGQEGEVDLQLVAEQREIRECICLPLVATLLMGSEVITLQCDQDGMEMDTAREEEDKKYVHLTFCHIKKLIHQLICWLFPLVWHNWYCIPLLLGLLKSDVISKVLVLMLFCLRPVVIAC